MKVTFDNFKLYADKDLYEAMVKKYGAQSYGDDKLAIKTNNSFASWMIAERVGDKYKIVPITSQNNERQSLQMEAYWTVLKEFPIKEFNNVPQFYKQWFVNRGLMKENKMNEATDIMIGDAYKKNNRIEIIIRRYSGDKWDTIEWDTKWKEIMAAGTSPENLIVGKKIELPSSLKKKIVISAKKEMKNPNNYLNDVGGLDAIKFALKEEAERDYKDEYKKFQSSKKSKKYRAELNKYNRDKGTYGNGDGKDASHKNGKISGFEDESKNKGRREKSRLKKESDMKEAKDNLVYAKAEDILAAQKFASDKDGKFVKNPLVDKKTKSIHMKMYKNGKYTDHIINRKGKEVKESVITKTRLREIIIEEYQKLNEERYYEELAKTLIKAKKVKKGMKQDDMIKQIAIQAKEDLGAKRARYYLRYDEDFLSDAISSINHYLKGR
jgi:hypothetical protein